MNVRMNVLTATNITGVDDVELLMSHSRLKCSFIYGKI
jgi:hypothetical protein